MAHFPPVYSDDESKILIAIYENPDVSYDTYALTQLLTGITAASPDFEAAFKKTLKAIEQLIVRGLVDGANPMFRRTNSAPISSAAARYSGRLPGLEPQKTQIRFMQPF